MTAEVLRRAAASLRADYEPWHPHDETCDDPTCSDIEFMRAVADWLDSTARHIAAGKPALSRDLQALAVARAYLGES